MTATQNYVVNPDKSGEIKKKPLIIKNLVSLKVVIFVFIGGLGCLFPFLPLHMIDVGLNRDEARTISIVAGIVSAFGPLLIGPIADNLAQRKGATGKHLRILAAIAMIISAILYAVLLAVPSLERFEEKRPLVSFGCDKSGAIIFQERIEEQRYCYHWNSPKVGKIVLTNCTYTCQQPTGFEKLYKPWAGSPYPPTESAASETEEDLYDETAPFRDENVSKGDRKDMNEARIKPPLVEPPHLCQDREDQPPICYAYIESTQNIVLTATLRGALNNENETNSADFCRYPLDNFQCNIPGAQVDYMHQIKSSDCQAMIECEIYDPYNSPDNILSDTLLLGDVDETFWMYLLVRSFADIFPVIAITLLNAAIIIATRETSTGRGDVGHQLVWGAIGWAIFSPIIGAIGPQESNYLIPIVVYCSMSVLAAIIVLAASDMPLSPPEWWWHTKSGMVAIPMSAIRKYGLETAALVIITLLLGICWSVMDTYKGWFIQDLVGEFRISTDTTLLVTLTLTVGAIAAIPILWYAEKIVDYCGHTNILISSFVFYVIRFSVVSMLEEAWFVLLMEALEPLTLGLTWITIVLYMRHIVPRKYTATGQALPVAAHFCLGKAIGAVIGVTRNYYDIEMFQATYKWMALACLITAGLYFLLYHCLFGPRCGAKPQPPPPELMQGMRPAVSPSNTNSNGNYTPLRVYHDGRGRKGHFRY